MFNQHRIHRVFKLITLLNTYPAKTVKRLSQSLEISERSCYRYLDLLNELGFDLQKDDNNKFILKSYQLAEPFTQEETQLIKELLIAVDDENPLVCSIRTKLPTFEEQNIQTNNIVYGHFAKIINNINLAIVDQRQIIIKKYQSANSESISDRIVEPIGFTSNYQYLCAFEIETSQNKYFKVERMGEVEVTKEFINFKDNHQLLKPDVFGFNESKEKFQVKLKLSMRAMLWLKDDYPETVNFLKQSADGNWHLDVEVNSLEPVNRIVRSMPNEIELIK